jgi:hypothetical protein
MRDREPVAWTPLTAEQWKSVPNADHTSVFTREEVFEALRLLVPANEASTIADELYQEDRDAGVFFFGDLLSALSTLSESAAERVRGLLSETAPEAAERIAKFRAEHSSYRET